MKKVFICSRYHADDTHTVEDAVSRALYACYIAIRKGYAPIAPHLYLPRCLDDNDPAEREAGISSVACPLYNCDGSFAAVMCISGPDFRFTAQAKQKWLPELLDRCRRASLCLTLRSFG